MQARALSSRDAVALADLVTQCRDHGGQLAYPQPADVRSMLAHSAVSAHSRAWWAGDSMVAWSLAQTDFGNIVFDVAPAVRAAAFDEEVVRSGLQRLAAVGSTTADTPVESDDSWRQSLLTRCGFAASGETVIHLLNPSPGEHTAPPPPAGLRAQELADRVEEYVEVHRAAFGTSYLTREVRLAWQAQPGFDPALDLVLVDDAGRIVAFAVSYLHGDVGEIGAVGVRPGHRGRGLAHVIVAAALERLISAGARTVTMSTAGTNSAMLATARQAGFAAQRRTCWWTARVSCSATQAR